MKKLVIFGGGDIGQLAHYYFENDNNYQVVAFTLDKEYIKETIFCNLPVVPFEQILTLYPPEEHDVFIALSYAKLNQLRKSKFLAAKELGYNLASYVSSQATIFNTVVGENCFILEDNTIQPFSYIGNNVTLWSGNHIGHHSVINDHCFIASHVVVSGNVTIEESCFIGVNATLRNNITIGERSVIGAGALILATVEAEGLYIGSGSERSRIPSSRLKNI